MSSMMDVQWRLISVVIIELTYLIHTGNNYLQLHHYQCFSPESSLSASTIFHSILLKKKNINREEKLTGL